jgi:SAM-dependent methyltransferase
LDHTQWTEIGDNLSGFRRNAAWRRHADSVNRRLLEAWVAGGRWKRLLKTDAFDEAVGMGVCRSLASRAGLVIAMDLSVSTLGVARRSHGLPAVVSADVRRLPIATGTLDAVVSLSTLDHFPSAAGIHESLGELHRVLRRGGSLILTMDNLANPILWLRSRLPQAPLRRAGIAPYFNGASCTPSQLSDWLAQAGFRIEKRRAILHCPRLAAIPVCRLLSVRAARFLQLPFLRLLMLFECLGRWPTAWLTGHFIAVSAVREDR